LSFFGGEGLFGNMRFFGLKLTVIILAISLSVPNIVFAVPVPSSPLLPPEIPVLFYGALKINDQAAPIGTKVSIHKKSDNLEIASAIIAKQSDKYFLEVPCKNYIGEMMVFRINNLIIQERRCVEVMTVPSVKLDLSLDMAKVAVDSATDKIDIPASISDSTEVKITFIATSTTDGQTTAIVGTGGLTLTRNSTVPANKFIVNFPANTIITGSSGWDGTLIAPTISRISVNVPVEEGKINEVAKVINIGFAGQILTFDQPVSILFPQMAGKLIGYSRTGSDFTEIINPCVSPDDQTAINADLVGSKEDCKIDVDFDLVIWTKHFTYFVIFSQSPKPAEGGSSGVPLWLLQQQQPKPVVTPSKEEAPIAPTPQLLGEKIYADGTLLRGKDKKVYIIANGQKKHVPNLKELAKYAGQKIYDVENIILIQYPEVLGIKVFADGMLIRGADARIYVIKNNKKQHIRSLEELRKNYFGKKIYDVSEETLVKY